MSRTSRRLFVLIPPLLSLLRGSSSEANVAQKETLDSGGRKRTCWIYRPPALSPDAATPLLLLLHGSGGDGASQTKEWQKLADKEGIVLAAPDALDSKGWVIPADGPQFLGDVVSFVRSCYPIDPARVYLFGHSAGAVFALWVGPMESEFFAAVAVHAGALREAGDNVLSYASRKIPVFLVVGSRDPYFPIDAVRRTKSALVAKGFRAELLEIPGHDHNYHRRSEEINRKVWDFLSPIRLEKDARFRKYDIR